MRFSDWVKIIATSAATLLVVVTVMMGAKAFIEDIGESIGRGIATHER